MLAPRIAGLVTVVLLGVVLPRPSEAQATIGLQAGYNVIYEQAYFGAHGRIPVGGFFQVFEIQIYPNVDLFVFDQRPTIVSGDVDVITHIDVSSFFSPYIGIGFGVTYEDHDPGEETHGDMNVVGGFTFDTTTPIQPFVEVEVSMFGTDTVGVGGGLGYLL